MHGETVKFEKVQKNVTQGKSLAHIQVNSRSFNKKPHNSLVHVKGGAVSIYATKAHRGSGCVAPVILNLNSK